MATTDIGRVTPIWRGFYSAATTYELNDIVIDASGSVWWHKSPEVTTGVTPAAGEIWDAVIDMSVFSGLIQAAITTAQTALEAAQAAVAEVTADTERAETAAENAENSAAAASESAAGVGAYAQAAEQAKNAAQTAASQAAASASSAGTSAASAGSSAQVAEASKTAAQTAASQAAGSAETASGAAAVVEQKKTEALAAIEAKGEEVLESIPEDYTELSGDVDELKESFNNYAQLQEINKQIRKGKLIPFDDYTLVEYIQSDATDAGQAKINTGLMLGPTLRTELDMALTQIGIENYMGREGVNGKNVRNAIGCSATIAGDGFYFGFGNENLSLGTADTERHLFYIDVPNLVYGYDDVKAVKSPFTYGSEYSSFSIYLFGRYAGGTVRSYAKLYSAKFYSSGVLVAYFVPIVRKSDNRPGMYDVIRQEFYTNSIVGKLIAGEPINIIDDTLSVSGKAADAKVTGDAIKGLDNQITNLDGRIETLENTDKPYGRNEKYDEFSACLQSTGKVSTYVFFTDPHIYRADVTDDAQARLFGKLREAYNSTPTDFIMCGGDWLQGGDLDVIPGGPTKAQACAQLGYVDGVMNKLFSNYKPVFGNHDSNYKNSTLSQNTVNNLMFRQQGKSYYDFSSDGTRYYVFDSGTVENPDSNITAYMKEQLSWFANALLTTSESNIAVCVHILYTTTTGQASQLRLSQFARYISEIAAAYNARASYTADWTTPATIYDYTGKTGNVRYIIAGHTHRDMLVDAAGIPCVIVANALYNWTTPTFDLCAEDHGSGVINLIRVGNGSNRYVHFGLTDASSGITLTPAKITATGWQSSNADVATVASGVVTAVATGTALISATDASGNTEAWVVSVTA